MAAASGPSPGSLVVKGSRSSRWTRARGGGLSGGTDKEGLSGDREETDVDLLGVGSMEANMYIEFLRTNDMISISC